MKRDVLWNDVRAILPSHAIIRTTGFVNKDDRIVGAAGSLICANRDERDAMLCAKALTGGRCDACAFSPCGFARDEQQGEN